MKRTFSVITLSITLLYIVGQVCAAGIVMPVSAAGDCPHESTGQESHAAMQDCILRMPTAPTSLVDTAPMHTLFAAATVEFLQAAPDITTVYVHPVFFDDTENIRDILLSVRKRE